MVFGEILKKRMKKLIVHIGYPKTATTSMQMNFYAKMHEENKIEYLNHLNKKSSYLGDFYCGKTLSYVMGMSNDFDFEEELEKIKLINNPISVISNENISFFSEDYSMAIHNSNAKKNARRIRKIFSPYFDEIQILMFTRAQVTIIPSFYAQLFNHITSIQPRFKKMSKWLETNFFEVLTDSKIIFNYNLIYNSYVKEFGEDNVKVCLFEDLKHKQSSVLNTLSSLFCVEKGFVTKYAFLKNKKNVTIKNSLNQIEASPSSLINKLKYFYSKYLRFLIRPEKAKEIKIKLIKSVPNAILDLKFKNKSRGLSADEKLKVFKIYEKSNLELLNKLGYTRKEMIKYQYLEAN